MARFAAIVAAAGLCGASVGCESGGGGGSGGSGGGNNAMQSRLRSLTGSIGNLGGPSQAKITAVVGTGSDKRQIPAQIDATSGRFSFDDLPAGPKTIVVEQAGRTRSVQFDLSAAAGKKTPAIVETRLAADSFDLGTLSVAPGGEHLQVERNPFALLIDTDGDGIFDALDDDIDGDGVPNAQDPAFYGDWTTALGWSWDDDWLFIADWDCNGDGFPDWQRWTSDLDAAQCGWATDWHDFWLDDSWADYDDGFWAAYDEYLCLEYGFCEDDLWGNDWCGDGWCDDAWGDDEWDWYEEQLWQECLQDWDAYCDYYFGEDDWGDDEWGRSDWGDDDWGDDDWDW